MDKLQRMLDTYNKHGMTALHTAQLNAHTGPKGTLMVGMLVVAGASDLPMRPCKVDGCLDKCRQPS